jgi:hypothetical protein
MLIMQEQFANCPAYYEFYGKYRNEGTGSQDLPVKYYDLKGIVYQNGIVYKLYKGGVPFNGRPCPRGRNEAGKN